MEKITFEQLPQLVGLILEKLERIEKHLGLDGGYQDNNNDMLTAEQASKYMGISMSNLYKLTSRREIPTYRPGGKKLYFKKEELTSWLSQNRIMTQKEIEDEAINYLNKNKLRF